MITSEEIFDNLRAYLLKRKLVDRAILASMKLEFSDIATVENNERPRQFAFVMNKEFNIYLARQFSALPGKNQIGILIHEISHLNLHTFFDSARSEVETDLWVVENLPESEYSYETIGHPITGKNIKNIQTVGFSFGGKILTGEF